MQTNAQFGIQGFGDQHGTIPCIGEGVGEGYCSSVPHHSTSRIVLQRRSYQFAPGTARGPEPKRGSSPASTGLKILGSDVAGAIVFSAVAGYVDTAGFMALFGLFTAHITGVLVTAGTTLAENVRFGSGPRLVMVPVFMASVAATTLFARRSNRSGRAGLASMLTLLTVALAIFGITGVTLRPLARGPDAWAVVVIGGAGVVAMGIQNTLMRNVLSSYSPTTIMTGNLTQCTIDLVEMALPDPANDTIGRRLARGEAGIRLMKFGFPLLGFMIGAFSGACLTHVMGLASIVVPTLVMGLLSLHVRHSVEPVVSRTPEPTLPARTRACVQRVPCTRPCTQCVTSTADSPQSASEAIEITKRRPRDYHAHSGTYVQMAPAEQLPHLAAPVDEARCSNVDPSRAVPRSSRGN